MNDSNFSCRLLSVLSDTGEVSFLRSVPVIFLLELTWNYAWERKITQHDFRIVTGNRHTSILTMALLTTWSSTSIIFYLRGVVLYEKIKLHDKKRDIILYSSFRIFLTPKEEAFDKYHPVRVKKTLFSFPRNLHTICIFPHNILHPSHPMIASKYNN